MPTTRGARSHEPTVSPDRRPGVPLMLLIVLIVTCVSFRVVGLVRHAGSFDSIDDVARYRPVQTSLQVFDPGATVWLTAGDDQQPGRGAIDDNLNGAIDDDGELGAMHSDDEVVVTRGERPASQSSRAIFRGAWQAARPDEAATGSMIRFRDHVGRDRHWRLGDDNTQDTAGRFTPEPTTGPSKRPAI